MSNQKNSPDTHSATSLPESAGGVTPCNSQESGQMSLYGPGAAHASHFPARARAKEPTTSDTSGLSSPGSSASAALQQSLASRLQARLEGRGSMEYRLTWKTWVTPQQRQICALRASARRTSDSDCFGWPSTKAQHDNRTPDQHIAFKRKHGSGNISDLNVAAKCVAGWATPTTRDHKDTPNMSHTATNPDGSTRVRCDLVGRQVGTTSISSDALSQLKNQDGTWKSGVGLNPSLSSWLMGYPVLWSFCGYQAMRKRGR